jgi:hypothetical protein
VYERLVDEVLDELAEEEYDAGNDLLDEDFDYAQSPNVFPVFLSGYRTVPGQQGRQPMFRRTRRRVGKRGAAISALFPQPQPLAGRGMQSRGLWVQGGLNDVRRYIQQLFPGQQVEISDPEAHGDGRSHVHVTAPGRGRSEHIFYGPPPRPDQNFFD